MTRHARFVQTIVALGAVAGVVACSSSDSEEGGATGTLDVTFDTFNAAIADRLVANGAARRQPAIDAIASMPSDIVCLQEVWFDTDKEAIVAAAKAQFPYSQFYRHTRDTPIDDPRNDEGDVPTPPTEPPCRGELIPALDEALTCIKEKCSTIPGSDEGKVTSLACPPSPSNCLLNFAPFLSSAEGTRCYGCVAPTLSNETFREIREECTTKPNGGYAFYAQNGILLLSKYPLEQMEVKVLPGTWNRRAVMRSIAKLPNGRDIDVYCTHLTAGFAGIEFPYTEIYHGYTHPKGDPARQPKTGEDAWIHEQVLQVKQIFDWMDAKPSERPKVLLGDFNSSDASGNVDVEAKGAALAALEQRFTRARAASYAPQCTWCQDNTNVMSGGNSWIDHVFIRDIPTTDVISTARTFDKPVVPVSPEDPANPKKAPLVHLSDHYGYRVQIRFAAK